MDEKYWIWWDTMKNKSGSNQRKHCKRRSMRSEFELIVRKEAGRWQPGQRRELCHLRSVGPCRNPEGCPLSAFSPPGAMKNCLLSGRLIRELMRERVSELRICKCRMDEWGQASHRRSSLLAITGHRWLLPLTIFVTHRQPLNVVLRIEWEGHKSASSVLALFSLSPASLTDWVKYCQDSCVRLSSLRQTLIRKLFLPKRRRCGP